MYCRQLVKNVAQRIMEDKMDDDQEPIVMLKLFVWPRTAFNTDTEIGCCFALASSKREAIDYIVLGLSSRQAKEARIELELAEPDEYDSAVGFAHP